MHLTQSFGFLLNTSARAIKRKLDTHLKSYNITTSQWAVLNLLSYEDNLSQAQLAEKTNTDRATCGVILDKLLDKGLIEKAPSKNDRRSYIVNILPAGRTVVKEVTVLAKEVNQLALRGLSLEEIDSLVSCLHKIVVNLNDTYDVQGNLERHEV